MRFTSATAVACLSACLAPVSGLLSDEYKVPGDNPLLYCPGDLTKEFLDIKSVDISPNPPVGGSDLTIRASGHVDKPIEQGATVVVQVRWGLIKLPTYTIDLCEKLEEVDMKCPVKGDVKIEKTTTLPPIPDGTFYVHAEVRTVDDQLITCMNATVTTHKPGFLNIEL